jgi:predicted nucleic acid-binding Zn ribbon protein
VIFKGKGFYAVDSRRKPTDSARKKEQPPKGGDKTPKGHEEHQKKTADGDA